MTEWKPIETVPKDGTKFAVWCRSGYVPWVYWDNHPTDPGLVSEFIGWREPATHWMPLPEPPEAP